MPNVVFYLPFPDVDKEEDYQKLVKHIKKLEVSLANLPLQYDSGAKAVNFEGYRKHIDELDKFKNLPIEEFGKRYQRKDEEVTFKFESYI